MAIVRVDKENRVYCRHEGCGRTIYAKIHIIQHHGKVTTVGSDCFSRHYQNIEPRPTYSGTNGSERPLTEAERLLLIDNTEKLIAQFQAELEQQLKKEEEEAAFKAAIENEKRETLRARREAEKKVAFQRWQPEEQEIEPIEELAVPEHQNYQAKFMCIMCQIQWTGDSKLNRDCPQCRESIYVREMPQ